MPDWKSYKGQVPWTGGAREVYGYVNSPRWVPNIPESMGYSADLCTGGTVTAFATVPGYSPSEAFDDNLNTDWEGNGVPNWIKYDFGTGKRTAVQYTVQCYDDTDYYISDWTFEGSNDNIEWTILDTQVNQKSASKVTYNFPNEIAYRYYRWNISGAGPSNPDVIEFEIKEFVMIAGSYDNLKHSPCGYWRSKAPQPQLIILNFNGNSGATTWIEEAQGLIPDPNHTWNFILDTDIKKFGESSVTPTYDEQGELWYDLPNLYEGDFTLHGWIHWTGSSYYDPALPLMSSFYTMIRLFNNTSGSLSQINIEPYNISGSVNLNAYISNRGTVVNNSQEPFPNPADSWHHIAIIGYGNQISYATDGAFQKSWTMNNPLTIKTLVLAAYGNPDWNSSVHFDAWELVPYAKWTESFSLPTTAPSKEMYDLINPVWTMPNG